jgi:hypothetical protein
LKIKLNGCYFDISGVMEAESQAMMNTLTEQDFQDAFKNGNKAYVQKGTTLRVMVASRPKASFDQMAVSVPKVVFFIVFFKCLLRICVCLTKYDCFGCSDNKVY